MVTLITNSDCIVPVESCQQGKARHLVNGVYGFQKIAAFMKLASSDILRDDAWRILEASCTGHFKRAMIDGICMHFTRDDIDGLSAVQLNFIMKAFGLDLSANKKERLHSAIMNGTSATDTGGESATAVVLPSGKLEKGSKAKAEVSGAPTSKKNKAGPAIVEKPTKASKLMAAETSNLGLAVGRKALVVGIGAYSWTNPLANPTNDSEDMANKLDKMGFEVTHLKIVPCARGATGVGTRCNRRDYR